MVFEVINDRGEKLRPYEVFKGALLGQLDKDEIDKNYNDIWKKRIEPLEMISEEEPDNFFRYYFRSKYVDSINDYREFDGDYHKRVFSNKWNRSLDLKRNPNNIKKFIKENFNYYSKLYLKLIDEDIFSKPYGEYVFYNRLNDQNRQYLLIMSACQFNDPDEDLKIFEVSKLFDRHFVLLQLFGCYDSNSFTDSIIYLNNAIRNKEIDEIKGIFFDRLIEDINRVKSIDLNDLFHYSLFKDRNNNLPIRFIRYFFARIENYISSNGGFGELSKNQYYDLVRNKGHVNGYHIEHILSNNDENRSLFNNDEEVFQNERNRLGALLLLKGKDNISSSNELYKDKLKTYSSSNLWNRTLINDFYHTNKDFHQFINNEKLTFKHYDKFDGNAVEERQRLLFDIIKKIWS